jgi:3-deoxy-D-manno-octulosonate 8-phosphate phosphatase (KDO 8-P phosphatase)
MMLEARAAVIRLVVLDVDGVLTDGALWYGPEGETFKRFDVKDGHAMVLARLVGLPIALLTARVSRIVEVRAEELKLVKVLQGRRDKGAAFDELCAELKAMPETVAYMGDDINDLAAMVKCGLAACPNDAVPEVKAHAQFVSTKPGGRGAVRELLELILKARGLWNAALDHGGVPAALRDELTAKS